MCLQWLEQGPVSSEHCVKEKYWIEVCIGIAQMWASGQLSFAVLPF